MVNPGAFQGKRKEFLLAEKVAYAAAVEGDYAADAIANIQRRYFKRFPVELPPDQEPTQEFLDAVNDDEADQEPDLPQEDELTPEEYAKAMRALEQRAEMIAFRRGQIKRWLVYQHMKDNSVDDPSRDGAYRALLQRLTGVGDSRPRQKTASNVWRRDLRDVIEAEARRRVQTLDKKKLAAIRQTVASEMFAALSKEEKEKWDKLAKTEHTFAVDKWEAEINGPPSTRPADRQKCILGIVSFVQPILDGMAAATGWKCSLIAGGPEPASGGRLTIVSAHAGTTSGDIKMNFVRAERQKYKDGVLPAFGSFLRKCYTPEDCRAFALSPNSSIHGMDAAEFEKEGSSVDALPDPEAVESTARPRPSTPPTLPPPQTSTQAVSLPSTATTSSSAAATQPLCVTASTATPMAACSTSTPLPPTATTSQQTEQLRETANPGVSTSTRSVTTPAITSTGSPTATSAPIIQPPYIAPPVAPVAPTTNPTPLPPAMPQHMDVDSPLDNSEPLTPLDSGSANSPSLSHQHPSISEETILSPPPPAGVPPPPKHPTPTVSPTPPSPPISPPLSPVRANSPPLSAPLGQPIYHALSPIRANSHPLPNDTLPEMPPPPSSPPRANSPPLPDDTHFESSHHLDNAPQHALLHPPPSAHVMSILSALSLYPLNAFPSASTTSSVSGLIRPSYTNSHRSSSPSAASTASSDSSCSTKSSSSSKSSSSPATSVTSMSDSEDEGPHTFGRETDVSARRTRSQASRAASVPKPRGVAKRQKGVRAVKDDAQAARRSKRQRVDGATTPAPDWFTKAWTGFASEDLGAKWTSFLELWRDFEGREGFRDGAKLGSRNRPAIIEEWIAHRHRSTTWRPTIDIKDFECGFKAWWISLQPDWRVSRGAIKKSQLDGDWGALKRSGKNGLLSIVAALFFWGVNAKDNAKSRKPWLTALDDCSSVLAFRTSILGTSSKPIFSNPSRPPAFEVRKRLIWVIKNRGYPSPPPASRQTLPTSSSGADSSRPPLTGDVGHCLSSAPPGSASAGLFGAFPHGSCTQVETKRQLGEPLTGHDKEIHSVSFSRDGTKLVSASDDGTIRSWSVKLRQPLGSALKEHDKWPIKSVAFSPDGRRIVSGSWDSTVRLWDAQYAEAEPQVLQIGHGSTISSIMFSPDGRQIASGSWDKTIRLWNADTGELLGLPLEGHEKGVECVAFSPDGKRLASGSRSDDATVWLWDLEKGQQLVPPLQGHAGYVLSVAFSPDGKLLASGSADKTIRLWKTITWEPLQPPLEGHGDWVQSVAFSLDGGQIASGSDDRTLRLWDVREGKVHGHPPFRGHDGEVNSVTFSPNEKQVASGSYDKTIRLWSTKFGQEFGSQLKVFAGHDGAVYSVIFSFNGQQIVSGSQDRTIRLWGVESGQQLRILRGHEDSIRTVAYSPVSRFIASGSNDKTIRVWDAKTDSELQQHVEIFDTPEFFRNEKHFVCFSTSLSHSLRMHSNSSSPPYVEADSVDVDDHGWTRFRQDAESNRLFWTPQLYRPVWIHQYILQVLPAPEVELDLSVMAHGSEWHLCYISGEAGQPP
ncbi:hypothetical protein CVT26_002511 [Gymnopilus dilepis]|uniref:Uncharacterized protein n=1 Tax=Gymnopilus dilepis TaxID=231916 RepID=A0A409YP72_9AGAR|nr:hypothetical protein CVT26_002511 [Gymnopilus dilepis]